jgi:hypothetical protein
MNVVPIFAASIAACVLLRLYVLNHVLGRPLQKPLCHFLAVVVLCSSSSSSLTHCSHSVTDGSSTFHAFKQRAAQPGALHPAAQHAQPLLQLFLAAVQSAALVRTSECQGSVSVYSPLAQTLVELASQTLDHSYGSKQLASAACYCCDAALLLVLRGARWIVEAMPVAMPVRDVTVLETAVTEFLNCRY